MHYYNSYSLLVLSTDNLHRNYVSISVHHKLPPQTTPRRFRNHQNFGLQRKRVRSHARPFRRSIHIIVISPLPSILSLVTVIVTTAIIINVASPTPLASSQLWLHKQNDRYQQLDPSNRTITCDASPTITLTASTTFPDPHPHVLGVVLLQFLRHCSSLFLSTPLYPSPFSVVIQKRLSPSLTYFFSFILLLLFPIHIL